MSDMSHGPGWWMASDGKWYPPESHPDRAVVPPPETEPESESSTPKPASFRAASPAAVSHPASEPAPDAPAAPAAPASRWLGRDRPTAPAPVADPERATDDAPSVSSVPEDSPSPIPAVAAPDAAPVSTRVGRRSGSRKVWALGAAVLVALAVAAVVVALVSKSASTLPTGSDTATIHITLPPTGEPSFSGTVGGLALTGTVSGSGTASSGDDHLFDYHGSLGGTAYVLHVSLDTGNNASPLQGSPLPSDLVTFRVTGTYGSEPVTATAVFEEPSSFNARSQSILVTGSFGDQFVDGTATVTEGADGAVDVKAKLDVLPRQPNQPTVNLSAEATGQP
jgi:hypothetical protein